MMMVWSKSLITASAALVEVSVWVWHLCGYLFHLSVGVFPIFYNSTLVWRFGTVLLNVDEHLSLVPVDQVVDRTFHQTVKKIGQRKSNHHVNCKVLELCVNEILIMGFDQT